MKTKLSLGLVVLASFLCGCGPPYTFSPFVGTQQNWTVGTGGYVRVVNKATIYPAGTYPERRYVIIGAVTTDNEDNLAKAVLDQKADAALISTQSVTHSGSVAVAGPGFVWAEPLRHSVVTANLIRFVN